MPHVRVFSRAVRRRGAVALLVAVLLIAILAILAIVLEGGLLLHNRRQVQAAADAAAMAAAAQLFVNYYAISPGTYDPSGAGATAAQNNATANGFPNDGTNSTVVVNIPPQSGPFASKTYCAEVIITYNQKRYFSVIWGTGATPVVARAVGRVRWVATGEGIIVLDPNLKGALGAGGNGAVTVTGGAGIIVDSNNVAAATVGGGGSITASNFEITGNYTGTLTGTVQTSVPPTPDPLAYLPVPAAPPDGTMTTTPILDLKGKIIGNIYTLTPGRYTTLPNFVSGDTVIMAQASANSAGGIYYLDGCGFTSTGANITMNPLTSGGLMIYNHPTSASTSQGMSISGSSAGTINLSAMTSGPYAGLLIWQDRTAPQQMSVSGNGSFTMVGTFYAADALLKITGNAVTGISPPSIIGSQYVSKDLSLGGNGNITINYADSGTPKMRDVTLVE